MNVQKGSVCPLDCPDTCSLAVTVSGDQVLAVRGSKANPITHGAICSKVANNYPEFVVAHQRPGGERDGPSDPRGREAAKAGRHLPCNRGISARVNSTLSRRFCLRAAAH
jgi:hypothetical protein